MKLSNLTFTTTIENFDPMYPVTITLAVALAVAGFYIGRANFIIGRLRRVCRKATNRTRLAEGETQVFRGAYLSVQNPSLDPLDYVVDSTGSCEYSVFIRKPLPKPSRPAGAYFVDIPIKTFSDYEDPEFAHREAIEFAEICRKN